MPESPLAKALRQFEATEANLAKLGRLWDRAEGLIPEGIVFGDDPEYEEACRSIELILQHLPKIDDWKPSIVLFELNEIAQNRLDYQEIDIPEATVSFESAISEPGKQIREYRFRLNQKRRSLVRDRIREILQTIDGLIFKLDQSIGDEAESNQ